MNAIRAKPFAPLALAFALLASGTAPQVADSPDWPRAIELPESRIVMYQPEPESFAGTDIVDHLNDFRKEGSTRSASLLDIRARIDPSILAHDLDPYE